MNILCVFVWIVCVNFDMAGEQRDRGMRKEGREEDGKGERKEGWEEGWMSATRPTCIS